jgi:hypothetical protein
MDGSPLHLRLPEWLWRFLGRKVEPMGRSEDIFARVSSHGEPAINEFLADRQSEELFLDFKRSADNGVGPRLNVSDTVTRSGGMPTGIPGSCR